MFCDEYMLGGFWEKKCGFCWDFRLLCEEWMVCWVYVEWMLLYEVVWLMCEEEVWGGDLF